MQLVLKCSVIVTNIKSENYAILKFFVPQSFYRAEYMFYNNNLTGNVTKRIAACKLNK